MTMTDIPTERHCDGAHRRTHLVLLLAALMLWLSGGRMAEASCGDYLHRRGVPVSSHGTMDSLKSDPGMFHGVEDRTTPSLPLSRCTGPNCSRSPGPQAPVESPVTIATDFDQAILFGGHPNLSMGRLRRRVPDAERSPHYEPMPVFRPPTLR